MGGVDAKDRELIRKIVETQSDAIIVASYGVFSTGINIKNIHNIILGLTIQITDKSVAVYRSRT